MFKSTGFSFNLSLWGIFFFLGDKSANWTEKMGRSVCGSEWPTHRDQIGWNHNICHVSANRTLRRWFIVQSPCAIGSSSRVRLRVGWLSRKTEDFYTLVGGVHGESQTICLDERFNFHLMRSVTPCVSLYELQRLDVCMKQRPRWFDPGSDHMRAVTTL